MTVRRLMAGSTVAVVLLAGLQGSAAGADDDCPQVTPTLVGTDGDDELVGTDGDDVIVALAGDDAVDGRGGNDVICGGDGTDRLLGGAGDDDLYGGANGLRQQFEDNPPDNVGDTLVPGPGDDHLDAGADTETDAGGGFVPDRISFAASSIGVVVDLAAGTAAGQGVDTIVVAGQLEVIGTAHDDVLLGSAFRDELAGGEGADVLRGRAGDDSLRTDPHGYRRDRPGWGDEAYGGEGDDHLDLGNGDDVGRGGAGRDALVDGAGSTDLRAGPGNDYLESYPAPAGGQQMLGGAGRDTLYAWAVLTEVGRAVRADGRIDLRRKLLRIVVRGHAHRSAVGGVEVLRVPDGVWRVRGTRKDERFYGAETAGSRLLVRAGGGDDLVSGTPGDDRINGGPGTDRGGDDRGHDVCTSIERWFGGQRCEVVR